MGFMHRTRVFLYIIGALALSVASPSVSSAQTSLLAEILRLQPAIVSIKAVNRDVFQGKPQIVGRDPKTGRIVILRKVAAPSYDRFGAGVFIDPSGIIVTNAHIVNRAQQITVTLSDKTEIPAEVFFVVNDLDLGYLKVTLPSPAMAAELGNSDEARLSDQVITVGNSSYLRQTVSGGKIIGLGQTTQQIFKGFVKTNNLIQTDINLYEGDSGGPLFDRHGQLIGLMTAGENHRDSSFAVPSNLIKRFLAEHLNAESQK